MIKILKLCGGLIANMFSSIFIIQVNKYIYINYGISNLVLTCLHFVITFVCLIVCSELKIFRVVKIPISKMIPMAISFCGFVVTTNYSLQLNSIGTYQCLKALTTPFVLFIVNFFYSTKYSLKVNLTVVGRTLFI
jgi:solute carrier family 35, member E3